MRPDGWEKALVAVVERHRSMPFAWGPADCGALVRDVAAVLGAADPFDGLTWDNKFEAICSLHKRQVRSVREWFASRCESVPPALARRGDVGFTADCAPLMCPAVLVGAEAVSRDEAGWLVLPRSLLVECYRL